jgi:hypothetical protein
MTCFFQGILLMSFTSTVCAQSGIPSQDLPPSGNWAATPVIADGILSEWPAALRYVDEEMPLAYDITNDGQNLYVAVRTTDPATQVNILRAGLTLGINVKGKKKVATAITYPQIEGSVLFAQRRRSAQTADSDTGGGSRYGRPSASAKPVPADLYRELHPHMDNAGIKGITGLPDGTINVAQRKTGIAAALTLSEGDSLNVEFVIPLSKLGLTPAYAKEIAYSITVNEDDGTGNGRGARGPRMSGLGIGVGVGGGMGVGMGGGVGMDIGGFGGRRTNGSGGKNGSTEWIKQPLARQPQ